ncbi:hypothetical protein [uncultured Thiodictyon sp.]|uniref:hypothetical protein n=1 Tax=uncultured Thiodictyon sp. TaxID=1846217 RepID=UPI0025DEF13B|nr:hypothetical protein [uncultured Thiodictyon sp.]
MTDLLYRFVPMGATAAPDPRRLWLDVGNRFGPGLIDHHQPDGPDRCTAALVLEQEATILAQAQALPAGEPLEIVTHRQPDLDAITATYFVESLLHGTLSRPAADRWAAAVCAVDRGHTRLEPDRPITPYAVFLACLELARQDADPDPAQPDGTSLAAVRAGQRFVAWVVGQLAAGVGLDQLGARLAAEPAWAAPLDLVRADQGRYRRDLARAERLTVALPRATGEGGERVPGLWIAAPESLLFKAWARGDRAGAEDPRGFVFTAVELSPTRVILSVAPGLGLWLNGLGEALEAAETAQRRRLGRPRRGEPRPGYAGPDPWYDGRSPLHGYTIVDAPHGGTLLAPAQVRAVFAQWLAGASPN